MARIVKGNQNKDRLSGLPDPLLHHIFSFLETENVIQTCVLSKRWRDFWSSFPFINLFFKKRKPSDFVKFSDSVLFHRDVRSNVHTLRVRCTVDIVKNVNSWIVFVSKRNVQVLDIQLDCSLIHNGADKSLVFSHRLYSCVSLKVLKLNSPYELKLPNHVYLPCLEILYFEKIKFDEDCFRQIISSCPKLHSLTMSRCRLLIDLLTITCPRLKTLILGCFESPFSSLEIFAPYLITLEIVHWKSTITVRTISDFPYLLNANIHAKFCSRASFNKLWIALRRAQSLNLSSEFLSGFGLVLENKPHANEWIPCPSGNLKIVNLGMSFVKHELLAIYKLLKVSPNLETFKLCNYAEDAWDNPCPADIIVWSELKLNRLKLVHFDNFYGNEIEMDLVKFFIKNAENLEKLRLEQVCPSECTEELAELTKILLACPRHVRVDLDSNSVKGTASLSVTFV